MAAKLYRILDMGLSVDSDSPEFLTMFERDYSWFSTLSIYGSRRLSFSLRQEKGFPSPTLQINETIISLKGHPEPARYAYQLINRILFKETKDYFILHAAVVAKGSQALIISGPPGVGKTTLTLSLLESGLRFLSDDFCPIHRETRLVYPFPRSLWISGQGKFAGVSTGKPLGSSPRRNKVPVKPDFPGLVMADGPCRPKCLIFLDPGEEAGRWQELEVGVRKAAGKELLKRLDELEKVTVEQIGPDPDEWRLRYPKGQGLTQQVRELLSRSGEYLWSVFRVKDAYPDFTRDPVLTPIPNHEAAFLMMSELKQDLCWGPTLEPSGSQPVGYFMELSELLEGMSCYRVTPGKLDALKNLALRTLEEGEKHDV